MSANPILTKMEQQVTEQGGDDALFDRVAGAESIQSIMASFGLSRTFFYRWLKNAPGRKDAYEAAKKLSAHALVEDGMYLLDNGQAFTPADVSRLQHRANYRKWLAGVRSRDEYGDAPQGKIDINLQIGQLHLDALRQAGLPPALPAAPGQLPAQDADYEIVPADDVDHIDDEWNDALDELTGNG
jgi:hypothetical protein